MEAELEKSLLEKITQKQAYDKSFMELVNSFDKKMADFNPAKNSFEIEKYFGKGNGKASVSKKLLEDKIIQKEWLREYETRKGNVKKDFKGLYVFLIGEVPFYVGISKGVIGRIIQHLKGHSHYTSTLAYNISLHRYEIMNNEKYSGKRNEFDFKTEVTPSKEFLLKQRVAFLPIKNDVELYLFEVYCAMHLKCWLNKFETH